jgi:hypothetical protein
MTDTLMPFIVKASHPIQPVKVMALIECNRNLQKMIRKTKDDQTRHQLINIMRANSKIIVSL